MAAAAPVPAPPAAPAPPAPPLGRGQRAHHPVRILTDGTIRTVGQDHTIYQFRRYLNDRRHTLPRVVTLARELMESLELVGDHFPEVNTQLFHELRMNARLAHHLVRGDATISTPAQIARDVVLCAGVRRRHMRHLDRYGLPSRPKTRLTRHETQGARSLRALLRDRIPPRRWPVTLGTSGGDAEYNIHGRWLQGVNEIWIHSKADELREAAQIDPSHTNDYLAIEDTTDQGVGCNVFKVLTRAQLLKQKALSLPGLPRTCFDQWNADVALRYP